MTEGDRPGRRSQNMEQLNAIRAREQAASAGPWTAENIGAGTSAWGVVGATGHIVVEHDFVNRPNAEFIAHAREDLPFLLALVLAYRIAACQMHNALVGHGNAGMFRADLAQEGVRLFDEAEAILGEGHPADLAEIRSYKSRLEAAEAALLSLPGPQARSQQEPT